MIRLTKTPEPDILRHNGAAWTGEYLAAVAAGDELTDSVKYRYRHPEIRTALEIENHSKCAYCESKMRHVVTEHIEHILPKSSRPDLIVTWSNLTLACPNCNQFKGEYYSVEEPLLNPYVDDPDEHLLFYGPYILAQPGSVIGGLTVNKVRLSRAELVERRIEQARMLERLVELWKAEVGVARKGLLEEEIRRHIDQSAEFAATKRRYLAAAGFPVDPAVAVAADH